MSERKMIFVMLLLVLVLIVNSVSASQISFGSVGENKRVTMLPGEVKEFKLSFFNYGSDPLYVEVTASGCDELGCSITPRYFALQNSKEVDSPTGMVEWVALGGGYVKAVPVFVKIKVPRNISEITRNYHVIKVMVKATTEKPTSSGIKEQISQAREFYYAVTIPGNVNAKTQEEYENSLKLEKFYEEYERIKNGINNESYGGYSKFNVKHPDETQSGGEERKINFPTGFFTLKNQEEGGGYLIYVMLIIVILLLLIYFIRKR